MKTALKIASILTWFNLLWWSLNLLSALPGMLAYGGPMLVLIIFFISIPLSSYAGLQLHKSIRRPDVKLSSNTPVGIRFVGLAAGVCGFIFILIGGTFLLYAKDIISIAKENMAGVGKDDMKQLFTTPYSIRMIGGYCLFLGICASLNSMLNIRLLRWYYLVHQSDVS